MTSHTAALDTSGQHGGPLRFRELALLLRAAAVHARSGVCTPGEQYTALSAIDAVAADGQPPGLEHVVLADAARFQAVLAVAGVLYARVPPDPANSLLRRHHEWPSNREGLATVLETAAEQAAVRGQLEHRSALRALEETAAGSARELTHS